MKNFRLRRIHLDFHTSEDIDGVGRDFDGEEFAAALAAAHVDSVTCFSRCHHGWLYYPSREFPERIHPHLARADLLGEQIRSCAAREIETPVYLTVQWDHYTARENPGWLVLDENGRAVGNGPYEAGFYRQLCLNTPYRHIVVRQAREVLEMYPQAAGIFLDIINVRECSCDTCRTGMVAAGFDPERKPDRRTYTGRVIADFVDYVSAEIRQIRPDASIFYNHSHVRTSHRGQIGGFTHLELESLPTGGWGYWDFPVTIRYARTLGVPCLGMTGKFHTAWGDFHSLKSRPALEYECFRSLAFGAGCSIGDQLHPRGRLSASSYTLIGDIYAQVEAKEPWCTGVIPLSEIAVLSPDGFEGTDRGGLSPDIAGCVRMLQEAGYQFNVVDEFEEFSCYRVLILPDNVRPTQNLTSRIAAFIDAGGGVISSYRSGLDETTGTFVLMDPGCRSLGDSPWEPDFFVPEGILASGLDNEERVMYNRCLVLDPENEEQVLSRVNRPFFNRRWRHFCSHMHAPSNGESVYPGAVRRERGIHFAHPVFAGYHDYDAPWYKTLVINALGFLLPDPMLRHDGPSSLVCTINDQTDENRYVLHALHYIPERRCSRFDTVSDVIPLYNVEMELRLPRTPISAKSVPEGAPLELIHRDDGSARLRVPEIRGHQMLELVYEVK